MRPQRGCSTSTRWSRDASLLLASLLLFSPFARLRGQEAIAIIVHPRNPVTSLPLESLRRLYLGQTASFPSGGSATLVETPQLREQFYQVALGMSSDRFRRHWIAVVFAGEAVTPPRVVGDADEVIAYVAAHPEAIAFVPLSSVRATVKTIEIDGAGPTEAAYPLRAVPRRSPARTVRGADQ